MRHRNVRIFAFELLILIIFSVFFHPFSYNGPFFPERVFAAEREDSKPYAEIRSVQDMDGHTLQESYFDAAGNPVLCEDGYTTLRRAYDDAGKDMGTVYL